MQSAIGNRQSAGAAAEVSEICPLTEDAVRDLLRSRADVSAGRDPLGRRQVPRWPFPGTIELWVPDAEGREYYALGTCMDLSLRGVGARCDESLPVGADIGIAVHQPEVSFHGRAVVRHCTLSNQGDYVAGLEFAFHEQA